MHRQTDAAKSNTCSQHSCRAVKRLLFVHIWQMMTFFEALGLRKLRFEFVCFNFILSLFLYFHDMLRPSWLFNSFWIHLTCLHIVGFVSGLCRDSLGKIYCCCLFRTNRNCMLNVPNDVAMNITDEPGQRYSVDRQCQTIYGSQSFYCAVCWVS